jgi:3-methylcrotonyl-CoA carboxylase alpha subunit
MIAKIIVCDADRAAAVGQLRRALGDTAVLGIATNRDFLARIAAQPEFAHAAIDTGFIERHRAVLIPSRAPAPDAVLAISALSRLQAREAVAKAVAARSTDPYSPWARADGWRLNGPGAQDILLRDGPQERRVVASAQGGEWLLRIGERSLRATGEQRPDGGFSFLIDGVRRKIKLLEHGPETVVLLDGESWRLVEVDPLAAHAGEDPSAGRLTAPMPGRVIQLMVEPGSRIQRGQPLMVIEAMKMEHTVSAPADGVVEAVRFAAGDTVEEGAELITLAGPEKQMPA